MSAGCLQTPTIRHDGETWRIIGQGAVREGKVYCHLASASKGVQQANGWNPMQICDWVDADLVLACATEREDILRNALHEISLASQNSMSSQRQCGEIARAALVKTTGSAS